MMQSVFRNAHTRQLKMSPPRKSLLELKALRTEKMTNSFECHENSENIENQRIRYFLMLNVVSLHLVAEHRLREAVNTNLKPRMVKCDNSTCGHPGKQASGK